MQTHHEVRRREALRCRSSVQGHEPRSVGWSAMTRPRLEQRPDPSLRQGRAALVRDAASGDRAPIRRRRCERAAARSNRSASRTQQPGFAFEVWCGEHRPASSADVWRPEDRSRARRPARARRDRSVHRCASRGTPRDRRVRPRALARPRALRETESIDADRTTTARRPREPARRRCREP
jgi:hypothetical protein